MGTKQLWMVVTLFLFQVWWCYSCLEEERIALLQFKASIDHLQPTLTDWVEDGHCCNWIHVTCNNTTGRIIGLDLSSIWDWKYRMVSNASWYLNASLFLPFKEIQFLDLRGNGIAGVVENNGFERLSVLTSLGYLNLSFNSFHTSFLSSLRALSSLAILDFSFNNIKGSIDVEELNNLTTLIGLHLRGNAIQGFKSFKGGEKVLKLKNLELLNLESNNLDNNILSNLSSLSSLNSLFLSSNQIKGSINVTELNALRNLEFLSLEVNDIHQFVDSKGDEGLLQLTNLQCLELSCNRFNNNIFQSLRELSSLNELYLRFSHLKGAINTKGLSNLTNLKTINLSYSKFEGAIFDQGLQNIEALYMFRSSLDKNAIESLRALSSLRVLDMTEANSTLFAEGLCQLKYLEELYMDNNNLNGILPSCLANLTSLRTLDVSSNNLSGNISFSPLKSLTSIQHLELSYNHFQIPISLSPFYNLTNLKYLHTTDNEIYEEIEDHGSTPKFQLEDLDMSGHSPGCGHAHSESFPKFLYHQYNLTSIDLSHTNIKDEFPHWLLDNNTNLESLYLVNNSLSGTLRLPIHPHLKLTELDISINSIHGQIPPTFASYLPGLRVLNISRNNFNGGIPSAMDKMSSLVSLDLSNNQLQGRIPEYFAKAYSMLDTLILSNNSIIGGIPMSLSQCSLLKMLDVSNNRLSGRIPEWMGSLSSLEYLDLSQNYFSGVLSHNFSPPSLQYVLLSKNHLQGSLTKAFHNCSQLITLDLSHNTFTGDIPEWIISLSQLSFLLLSYNHLEGEIPRELCILDQLSFMDLSHNNFSGQIPSCLSVRPFSYRYTSQEEFLEDTSMAVPPTPPPTPAPPQTLVFTAKSASYAYHGRILEYMSGIDLSCNNMKGEIPHEFGNISEIKVLNLSHNGLVGNIPPTFSNLREIETLDLSFNNLNGSIPQQLIRLYSLEVFSVAHNNLSGKTPERVAQFGTFEEDSYEDNPFLCGPPLPKSCNQKAMLPSISKDATVDEGNDQVIDMNAFWVTFVVSYATAVLTVAIVLYINPRWRRAWFYLVEHNIINCYYFIVDNVPFLSKLRLS